MRAGLPDWTIILHGGAKQIKLDEEGVNRSGCREAAEAGAAVLRAGGSAVDAVVAAVKVLERLPTFNAGYGSVLNDRGEVEMCAGLMDGGTLDVGAVGSLMGVRHPVEVAHAMLRDVPVLLVAEGARAYAEANEAELCSPEKLISPQQEDGHDTVGAVARDTSGHIAAATSTGGLERAHKGRIGDSPMPGCGFYAEDGVGGVALSGHGEGIARLAAAARISAAIEHAGPEAAIAGTLRRMEQVGGNAGAVAIGPDGRAGWWHNSPHFAVALFNSDMNEPATWLHKDEEQA